MKFPEHKMPLDDLIDWIFENDYDSWATMVASHFIDTGRKLPDTQDDFDECVTDAIIFGIHDIPQLLDCVLEYSEEDEDAMSDLSSKALSWAPDVIEVPPESFHVSSVCWKNNSYIIALEFNGITRFVKIDNIARPNS